MLRLQTPESFAITYGYDAPAPGALQSSCHRALRGCLKRQDWSPDQARAPAAVWISPSPRKPQSRHPAVGHGSAKCVTPPGCSWSERQVQSGHPRCVERAEGARTSPSARSSASHQHEATGRRKAVPSRHHGDHAATGDAWNARRFRASGSTVARFQSCCLKEPARGARGRRCRRVASGWPVGSTRRRAPIPAGARRDSWQGIGSGFRRETPRARARR
jgi:hypothetical protein